MELSGREQFKDFFFQIQNVIIISLQRAVSMLEPMTSYNDAPATNGRYVKHIRSSSTLAPMPETPNSRRIIHQRSTSNSAGNGVNRVTSFASPSRHGGAAKTLNQQQRQLHKSTSNLSSHPDGSKAVAGNHQRSSSTPYEGFVV
jgi:hypothetical protein